jgi:hypothetical protein
VILFDLKINQSDLSCLGPHFCSAVNTVDFFNQINMLYGTITEYCTPEKCPIMSAGPKYEYHWADGQQVRNNKFKFEIVVKPSKHFDQARTAWGIQRGRTWSPLKRL